MTEKLKPHKVTKCMCKCKCKQVIPLLTSD